MLSQYTSVNSNVALPISLFDGFIKVVGGEEPHEYNALSYLIDDDILIDCGSREGFYNIKRNLIASGIDNKKELVVIATHGHRDHCEAITDFRKWNTKTQLWMHSLDSLFVETGDVNLTGSFLYNRTFRPAVIDKHLYDEQIIKTKSGHRLHVFHTPGHSRGSICLLLIYKQNRILFAGDTLWGCYDARLASDLQLWKLSLAKIMEMKPTHLLPGHLPLHILPQSAACLSSSTFRFAKGMTTLPSGLVSPW